MRSMTRALGDVQRERALDFTPGGLLESPVGGAATLDRIMFVTRKFIAGSGKDRGAWPWRAWAALLSA
jgi:hypothetical protein